MVQDHWPVGSEPQFVTTLSYSWTQSHGGDSAVSRGWRRCPNRYHLSLTGPVDAAWCTLDGQCAPNRIEADKQCSITDSHGVMVAALSAQEKL